MRWRTAEAKMGRNRIGAHSLETHLGCQEKAHSRMNRSRPGAARLEAIARKEMSIRAKIILLPGRAVGHEVLAARPDTLRRIVRKGARAIRPGRGRVTGHKTRFFPKSRRSASGTARRTSSGARTCLVPSPDRRDPSSRDGARSGCRDPHSNWGAGSATLARRTSERDLSSRCEFCRKAEPISHSSRRQY